MNSGISHKVNCNTTTREFATVYLGLGSNIGNRERNIASALKSLTEKLVIERVSSLYETEPQYNTDQPSFLNAACRAQAVLRPPELLDYVKDVEASLGRISSFPNSPRPIDIDILVYGNHTFSSQQLTVPHLRLAERAFVLVPLAEIAPNLVIPSLRKPVVDLAQTVGGLSGVHLWGNLKSKPPMGKKHRPDKTKTQEYH